MQGLPIGADVFEGALVATPVLKKPSGDVDQLVLYLWRKEQIDEATPLNFGTRVSKNLFCVQVPVDDAAFAIPHQQAERGFVVQRQIARERIGHCRLAFQLAGDFALQGNEAYAPLLTLLACPYPIPAPATVGMTQTHAPFVLGFVFCEGANQNATILVMHPFEKVIERQPSGLRAHALL